jgi:outer membrane protein
VKNLSLILNVILIIAVGILYFLHFSSGHSSKSATGSITMGGTDIPVAYIIEDSIMNHYDLSRDLESRLNRKQTDLENSYQTRAQNLQEEIENYRKRAGTLAPRDAQNIENQLTQKQQNLYQYQQSLNQEMVDEQNKVNDELYDHVTNYLEDYAKTNGYKIILNLKRGSGMLYGVNTLNITDEVIKGLNEKYYSEKLSSLKGASKSDSTKAKK